jgi:HEPN domain-containing protein/predicted nucleotidyltransferase
MSYKKKSRYIPWIEQAKFDLKAARLSMDNTFYEWSCYQAVQSVEKALKAVIVHAGWVPPKSHKLGVLVSMSNKANHLFTQVQLNFRKLESYTFISRYPFVFPNRGTDAPHSIIEYSDAETCVQIAEELIYKVNEFINQNQRQDGIGIELDRYYFTESQVDERIEHCIKAITEQKEIDVSKIILFGSFARNKQAPKASTIDMLIIGETTMPFIERMTYIREVTKGEEPITEPIVYTEEEFRSMLDEEGEGFLESAINEGKVIWEKEGSQPVASEKSTSELIADISQN